MEDDIEKIRDIFANGFYKIITIRPANMVEIRETGIQKQLIIMADNGKWYLRGKDGKFYENENELIAADSRWD